MHDVASQGVRNVLTTTEAAAYCGYKNPSAIRNPIVKGASDPAVVAAAQGRGCGLARISTATCEGNRRLLECRRTA
jgi:hypothetical protein